MRIKSYSTFRRPVSKTFRSVVGVGIIFASAPLVRAVDLYWDTNGATAGASAGNTAAGNWNGTDANFNTDSTGGATGSLTATTTNADPVHFSAGTNATGSFTITVSGTQAANSLLFEEGTVTLSTGTVNLTGGTGGVDVASGATGTITGVLTGGAITKTGSGTLNLNNAANTFSNLTLNGGILSTNQNSTFAGGAVSGGPFGTGTLTLTSGTISLNQTIGNNLSINGDVGVGNGRFFISGSTINLNGGTRTMTLNTRGNTFAGAGTPNATVHFQNSTNGPATRLVSNGTLRFVADPTSATTQFSAVNVDNTGQLTFSGGAGLTIGNRVVFYNNNNNVFSATSSAQPALTIESGGYFNLTHLDSSTSRSVQIASLAGAGTVTNLSNLGGTGTVTVTGSATTDFTGTIVDGSALQSTFSGLTRTGVVAFTLNGTGQQTLSGNNSYSGGTTVTAGTLGIGHNSALGSGTLTLNGNSAVITAAGGARSINNNVLLTASPTVSGTNSLTINGSVTGSGANRQLNTTLTTGTLTLAGNVNLGEATGSGRTLSIGSSSAAGAAGTTTLISGVIQDFSGGAGTTAGNFAANGGGTVILTGNNTYTGTTAVNNAGTILDIGNGGATGNLGGGNVTVTTGTLKFNRNNAYTLTNAINGNGTIEQAGSGSTTINAGVTGGALVVVNNGTLTLGGTTDNSITTPTINSGGTLVLAKASSGSPNPDVHAIGNTLTTINSGGTLQIAGTGGDQIFNSAQVTANSGATFDLNGRSETINALNIGGTGVSGNGALVNTAAATSSTLTAPVNLSANTSMGGAGDLTLASAINNSFTITKVGNGTLTLNASNNHAGTIVNAGTLKMGNANALGSTANPLTVNGGTVDLNTFNLTVGVLSGTGGTINSSASGTNTLTANSASNSSYTGTIANGSATTFNFTKNGAGTLALGGSNSYNGVTTISGGTLSVGTLANGGSASGIGASSSAASNLVINSGGTLQYTGGTVSVDRAFSGSGGTIDVTQAGTTLTLSGTSFTGFTKQGAGSLTIGTAGTGGAVTGNVTVSNGTVTLSGTADNAGVGSTVNSGGTLVLDKASSPTVHALGGVTQTINTGGTLLLAGSGGDQIFNSAGVVLNGGTFNTAGLAETVGALTLSSNSVLDLGTLNGGNALTFADSSANAWTGTLSIWNWSGSGSGGGLDQVIFANTSSDGTALTAAQLGQISFFSDAGMTSLGTAQFVSGSFGEIVPVPEPASVLGALALVGLIGYRERRHLPFTRAAHRA